MTAFLSPSQGLHSAPPSSFIPRVSAARLILDEAARLLSLLWRVSLPTDGQCTLHCEQVGGDVRMCRLGPQGPGSQSPPHPGQDPACSRGALGVGNVSEGREGGVIVKVTCQTPCWRPQAFLIWAPGAPQAWPVAWTPPCPQPLAQL